RMPAARVDDGTVGVGDHQPQQLDGRTPVGVFDDRVHQVDGGPERVAAVTDEVHWPITTTAPPGKLPNIYAYYRGETRACGARGAVGPATRRRCCRRTAPRRGGCAIAGASAGTSRSSS